MSDPKTLLEPVDLENCSSADRRKFLQQVAGLLATGASLPALAQMQMGAAPDGQAGPMDMGVLGPASAGPDRLKVAMLAHPKMVFQDFLGPLTVFNLIHCEIHICWKTLEPVMTETGLTVQPTTLLQDCPSDLDVLFVPGGLDGSIAMMQDDQVLDFLADRGSRARYVTSVCTGSLVLGAAGLLQGYEATGHWYIRDLLSLMGATPVNDRVVRDRNRITGGGVTAGLDFGLTIAAELRGIERAQFVQLVIEYAPAPPFDAGLPETAPQDIYRRLLEVRSPAIERARQLSVEAAARQA